MRNPRPRFAACVLAWALAGSCSESTGPEAGAGGLRALDSLAFTRDWVPGSLDRRGLLMTGTETLWLTSHRGWLFAALGVWNLDASRGPNPGGKVLVKRSAGGAWEVDGDFGNRILRVTALASLTFRTDLQGRALPLAETLLVAGISGVQYPGQVMCFVRNDASGAWVASPIGRSGTSWQSEVRQLTVHRDRVTGADLVVAAVSNGRVYHGGYDPSAPGRIAWDTLPEIDGLSGRILGLAPMNGDLYIASDPELASPGRGGLYRRVDGPAPRWERLGQWGSIPETDNGLGWLRGLTAVPDPDRPLGEVLLGGRSADGVIDRLDGAAPPTPALDADVKGLLRQAWGLSPTAIIIAYNNMLPATDPRTGRPVHLVGLGASMPTPDDTLSGAGWYLVRDGPRSYRVGRVLVLEDGRLGRDRGLRAVRTIAASPFPEEEGEVWYFGGFDAAGGPHHNTAWIYRGVVR